jgi:hypothetical protein
MGTRQTEASCVAVSHLPWSLHLRLPTALPTGKSAGKISVTSPPPAAKGEGKIREVFKRGDGRERERERERNYM